MDRLLEGTCSLTLSVQGRNRTKVPAVLTNPRELTNWNVNLTKWIAVDTPSICRVALSSGYATLKINPGTRPCVQLGIRAIDTRLGRTPPKTIGHRIPDGIPLLQVGFAMTSTQFSYAP